VLWGVMRDPAAFDRVFPNCRTRDDRIHAINEHLANWTRINRPSHRLPTLTIRSLFDDGKVSGFPSLLGPAIKAANTRACAAWVVSIAALFDDHSVASRHRLTVCESIVAWYKLVYSAGVVLTHAEFRLQFRLVQRCLRSYQWLAWDSAASGVFNWHIIPKHHFWAEMAYQAELLNPRFQQCYSGESMVGRVMPIFKRSINGPCRNTVQRTVLRKYALGFQIDVSGIAG
jgi:hypothetical protein